MQARHEVIHSPHMGRNMHVWCYGHWGKPVLAFPTAGGYAHEFSQHTMLECLAPWINGGLIKLYCTESNVAETWNNSGADNGWRAHRNRCYMDYVEHTLVPAIRRDCGSETIRLASMGFSLGAYYAMNSMLRFPGMFNYTLCCSGRYDLTNFTEGFSNGDIYYNNPMAYLGGVEGEHLTTLKTECFASIVCGLGAFEEGCIENTQDLAWIMNAKGIPHWHDQWGKDSAHQWPWWKKQVRYHLGKAIPLGK